MKVSLTRTARISLLIALFQVCSLYAQTSTSTTKTLFAFSCNSSGNTCPQGEDPNSLIQAEDGNFYGTTGLRGTGNQAAGTVFKITPAGRFTTLYTFVANAAGDYPNGANPTSLIEGNDGFLYGTTNFGGGDNQGVVFKLSKAGKIQIVHSFCPNCGDGINPFNLVLGSDGNFYGCTAEDSGQLFRLTPTGSFKILHTFNLAVDGPQCLGMILASDGNIYGDTLGALSIPTVLFRLTPAGEVTDLHTWRYSQLPISPPTETSDGSLWGALSRTGAPPFSPALFAVEPSGSNYREIKVTYPSGEYFLQFITQVSDGNFWGTVSGFGSCENCGSFVGRFSLNGELLEQIPFSAADTSTPTFLLQASNGTLLGITNNAGAPGEIFAVEPALAPPQPRLFRFNPSSGEPGSEITIQGAHLVGTTAVKFNGISAAFHVLNTGNIKATVPAGAATGSISITNAGGEAVSSASFTVD
jgi:uncharacterized repeat protein (TIGR03803 family)